MPLDLLWEHFTLVDVSDNKNGVWTVGDVKVKVMANSSHKNAWCRHQVNAQVELLKQQEAAVANADYSLGQKTLERRRRAKALSLCTPIRGELSQLATHILKCPKASATDQVRATKRLADQAGKKLKVEGPVEVEIEGATPAEEAVVVTKARAEVQTTLKMVVGKRQLAGVIKKEHEEDFLTFLAAINAPLAATENPVTRWYFNKWHHVLPPSRTTLSGPVMLRCIAKLDVEAKEEAGGGEATLTFDGYNNIRRQHLILFVVLSKRKAHVLGIEDNTTEQKTGELALSHVKKYVAKAEAELGVQITCICTDDGSDCAYARRQYVSENPHIVVVPCYAHQINLVVGDVFKRTAELAAISVQLLEVVNWFRNHSRAFGLLSDQRKKDDEPSLVLIRPVLTRWTSHYASASRVLELKRSLMVLAVGQEKELTETAGTKAAAKEKAAKIIKTLRSDEFWAGIEGMVSILAPLAVGANIAQATSARFDEVFLLFGKLFLHYAALLDCDDPLRKAGAKAALASLDARWKAADQDAFLLAAILNPFFGQDRLGLAAAATRANGGLYKLFERTYLRMMKPEAEKMPPTSFVDWQDYFMASGRYSRDLFNIEQRCQSALKKGTSPCPLELWRYIKKADPEDHPVADLAIRLLSFVPNSAANERVFSTYGNIHTKTRNALDFKRVNDLSRIRTAALKKHPAPPRKRRHTEVDSPAAAQFLSTSARNSTEVATAAEEDVIFAGEDDFERTMREWFRDMDEERTYVENDAPPSSTLVKLSLSDTFDAGTGLKPIADQTLALWSLGEEALALEGELFGNLAAEEDEGWELWTMEDEEADSSTSSSKRARVDVDLSREGEEEE